jgi:hypothetical protein
LTYVGTRVAPKPGANAAAKMKRLRRVNGTVEMIRRPLVATEAKRKVVMPPSRRDCYKSGCELAKDAHDDEPKAGCKSGLSVGTSSQGYFLSALNPSNELKDHEPTTPQFWANTDIGLMV